MSAIVVVDVVVAVVAVAGGVETVVDEIGVVSTTDDSSVVFGRLVVD